MGRFRIQSLLESNTWNTRYNLHENDRYNNSSTQWTSTSSNFTAEIHGIKLIYDGRDSSFCDLCFSSIAITHSVY